MSMKTFFFKSSRVFYDYVISMFVFAWFMRAVFMSVYIIGFFNCVGV